MNVSTTKFKQKNECFSSMSHIICESQKKQKNFQLVQNLNKTFIG